MKFTFTHTIWRGYKKCSGFTGKRLYFSWTGTTLHFQHYL